MRSPDRRGSERSTSPQTETTGRCRAFPEKGRSDALNVLSERQQSDARDFEALHSKRDADDSDAKNHPGHNVLKPDDEAPTENDPQDVEKRSKHYGLSLGWRIAEKKRQR
jgi:hypothetical protein